MTPRHRRFNKVEFRRLTTSEDGFGTPAVSGSTLICEAWAAIFYGRGTERREAAIEGAEQSATFNVATNADLRAVRVTDVIQLGGDSWDITSVAPMDRSEIDFTAVRRMK
jgi:hypothetical protein